MPGSTYSFRLIITLSLCWELGIHGAGNDAPQIAGVGGLRLIPLGPIAGLLGFEIPQGATLPAAPDETQQQQTKLSAHFWNLEETEPPETTTTGSSQTPLSSDIPQPTTTLPKLIQDATGTDNQLIFIVKPFAVPSNTLKSLGLRREAKPGTESAAEPQKEPFQDVFGEEAFLESWQRRKMANYVHNSRVPMVVPLENNYPTFPVPNAASTPVDRDMIANRWSSWIPDKNVKVPILTNGFGNNLQNPGVVEGVAVSTERPIGFGILKPSMMNELKSNSHSLPPGGQSLQTPGNTIPSASTCEPSNGNKISSVVNYPPSVDIHMPTVVQAQNVFCPEGAGYSPAGAVNNFPASNGNASIVANGSQSNPPTQPLDQVNGLPVASTSSPIFSHIQNMVSTLAANGSVSNSTDEPTTTTKKPTTGFGGQGGFYILDETTIVTTRAYGKWP